MTCFCCCFVFVWGFCLLLFFCFVSCLALWRIYFLHRCRQWISQRKGKSLWHDKASEENEQELVIVVLSLLYQIISDQVSSFLSIICWQADLILKWFCMQFFIWASNKEIEAKPQVLVNLSYKSPPSTCRNKVWLWSSFPYCRTLSKLIRASPTKTD